MFKGKKVSRINPLRRRDRNSTKFLIVKQEIPKSQKHWTFSEIDLYVTRNKCKCYTMSHKKSGEKGWAHCFFSSIMRCEYPTKLGQRKESHSGPADPTTHIAMSWSNVQLIAKEDRCQIGRSSLRRCCFPKAAKMSQFKPFVSSFKKKIFLNVFADQMVQTSSPHYTNVL